MSAIEVEGLRELVRGRMVDRTDEDYDDARSVYNGAVDRHPLAVVRVVDVADVIACVNFARDHQSRSRCEAAATTAPGSASGTTPW